MLANTSNAYSLTQSISTMDVAPVSDLTFTSGCMSSTIDSGWGLFDVQPTLDWLDADFSVFNGEDFPQE